MTAPTNGKNTRERIIRAAEELFAARGIEAVSLRQINLRAAQHNTGAVQYHFGDRDGLLQAILGKHNQDIEPRRHALLDQYEASDTDDIRGLAAIYVLPLAAKLDDPDGGREYLQIIAEYFARPARLEDLVPVDDTGRSMARWHKLADPLLPVEQESWLSFRFPAMRFTHVELARRAAGPPRPDNRLFISHLVDLVTSVLTAQPSTQTARILEERRKEPRPG